VGGSFIASEPKEEFRQNVGNGYGAGGSVMYHLLRSGVLSLRFDASGVVYGNETKRGPFSQTVGGRILVDVTTTNWIADISWGPELAVPSGWVRPYAGVAYSRLFFRTTSTVEGIRSSDEPIASTTNFKDGTGAWVYSGGLRFPFGRTSPASLDVGLRYHRGGNASYLREGSILDNPDGSITILPLSSRTPFLVYSIGVQFRIPHKSGSCSSFLCSETPGRATRTPIFALPCPRLTLSRPYETGVSLVWPAAALTMER
jgi:hypothetical protein